MNLKIKKPENLKIMIYKIGNRGPVVKHIQEELRLTPDGIFGKDTEAAVIKFQRNNHIVADGLVGNETLDLMGILDTDTKLVNNFTTENGLKIIQHHLPKGEYIEGENGINILNEYIFLHHTAGWNDPFKCIDDWGRDDRGRVATEFVLGGQNIKNGDTTHDGVLVQAFPEGGQGWHLGKTGSRYMARHSVGIEICNFGYLTDSGKTYVNTQAHDSQITTLSEPFHDHLKWHKYSDSQINILKKWILYVASRDNIDIREGLQKWIIEQGANKAFEFQQDAYLGNVKGLLTHTNVRKDKTDCFPQPELVDMIVSL